MFDLCAMINFAIIVVDSITVIETCQNQMGRKLSVIKQYGARGNPYTVAYLTHKMMHMVHFRDLNFVEINEYLNKDELPRFCHFLCQMHL